jgi:transcriptional regulator with XRE-family HTH domain
MPELLNPAAIKARRESLDMTMDDAAAAAGFKGKARRQVWYQIESGTRTNITLDTLARIAKALKVSPCDLLKGGKR